MKKNFIRFLTPLTVGITVLLILPSCSLDVTNPNNASEEQVLTTSEGIKALVIGLQQYYANGCVPDYIVYPAVTSREMTINSTYLGMELIEDGGAALDNTSGQIRGLWYGMLRTMQTSEDLLEYAPQVSLDRGTLSGIEALAHLFKGMAIGQLSLYFEQVPLNTDPDEQATFSPRLDGLEAAVNHLETALDKLVAEAVSDEFTSDLLGSQFDLENTIHAYQARYNLILGNYQDAIDATDLVDLTATSYFSYDITNQNPVYGTSGETSLYMPRDSLGTPVTEAGDERLDFWLIPDSLLSNPLLYPIDRLAGFFGSATDPIPVYYPSEMTLVKAEAYFRQGNTTAAIAAIDEIRTKTAAEDPLGIGANLSPYSGLTTDEAIEEEIYRQRSAELYLTGMRFEDSRRLGRPGPPNLTERNRNFYPYPDRERINNPNTPADPDS